MKVTVKTFLNVRVGKPSVNAPCYQYLAPGTELEVDGNLYPGDKFEGIDFWLKDEAGNYYWSGGVDYAPSLLQPPSIDQSEVFYWVQRFGLDEAFERLKEQVTKVRITILDTGIDEKHPDLTNQVKQKENLVWCNKVVDDNDGHGTHCSGILVGAGTIKVKGILPGCKLNVGKVMNFTTGGFNGLNAETLIDAINTFAPISDVISISAGIPNDVPELHQIIKKFAAQGVLFVAAIGNIESSNTASYPAKYEECIGVGALDANLVLSKHTIRDSGIDICFPGENIVSAIPTSMGSYGSKSGTSMATPFVAGIVALIKAKNSSATVSDIKQELAKITENKTLNAFNYNAIINKKLNL